MLENEIANFANRMNMPSFSLNEKGMASLVIGENEDAMLFSFEKTESELLLYLSIPVKPYDTKASERVLELSHYKYNHPFPLTTGLYNNKAFLISRFEHAAITAATIENVFEFLMKLSLKIKEE